MIDGEYVGSRIKPTENTALVKLSVIDQFKLILSKIANNDVAELDANEKLSVNALRMKASLTNLFQTAISKIETGEKNSCMLEVSSEYIPFLDDVIDPEYGLGRFYNFTVYKKDLPITVKFKFLIKIERKVT